MKKKTNHNATLNDATEDLLRLLPSFKVKKFLQVVPDHGLRHLNIRLIEKVPETTLGVAGCVGRAIANQ